MAPRNTATRPQTLDEWRKAIRAAQHDVHMSIKRFGEMLVAAKKELSALDWETLYNELRQDHTKGELDAAIAVGDGGLDERLFPAGVVHSKVMNMTRQDQERLLSGEKFPVYSDRSPYAEDAEEKTWAAMSREQRGRLISDKGGRIKPLNEQNPPKSGRVQRVQVYLSASYRSGDGHITFRSGNREGRIDLTALRHSMTPQDREALAEELAQ